MDSAALTAAATAWLAADPDPVERAALQAVLGDVDALRELFGTTLDFGTGGMRGPMGPGSNRMNRLMVRRVTAALADELAASVPDARQRGVTVAYDARRNSRVFAQDASAVLAARGFVVHLAPHYVPTPLLSFATVQLGACAGIIVTASHNPPADNGYKVFGADGAQIVAPVDEDIQARLAVMPLDVPTPSLDDVAPQIRPWADAVLDAYFARIAAVRVHHATGARIVYTPVHGVGRDPVLRALGAAGHTDVHVVPSQGEPDGSFPTVPFPNPEEPGVLDAAIALAKEVDADVILANDPDADRLAVAVPDGKGGWRQFSGNQLGVLLAEDLLSHQDVGAGDLVVTTIVSTAMLAPIAAHHGVAYAEALTGFKWIAVRAKAHTEAGGRFLYGFEESIGYSIGDIVRDKDGVSAALVVADLVSWLKADGRTLLDTLDDLYRQHGLYLGRQRSLRFEGSAGVTRIQGIMAALRQAPPTQVAGRAVVAVRDVLTGHGTRDDGTVFDLGLPRSNVIGLDLADGSRVLVRPSGTEPKIKFYYEVVEPLAAGEPLAGAEGRARVVLDQMDAELLAAAGAD